MEEDALITILKNMKKENHTMNYKHPLEIPKSNIITGLRWIGEREEAATKGIYGDTYPMAWAADGEIYMSSGDPNWAYFNGIPRSVGWQECIPIPELYPNVGGLDIEKIKGMGSHFDIEQVNTMPGFMGPGGLGAKPSGMISVNGSLYLAAQNLLGNKTPPHREKSQHGSDSTILRSDDYGRTWVPDIQPLLSEMESRYYDRESFQWKIPPQERQTWDEWKPMFPGPLFGGPSFVQFGQNNSQSVDEYVYAISGDQWDNGSEMRLGRVHQDHILEVKFWEWANVKQNGSVEWVNSLANSLPVLTIDGHLGLSEMVYLPSIKRYLLLTWGLHKDFNTEEGSELTILEAEQPWGPFSLVYYEELWDNKEICPYCPRIQLKWFDEKNMSGKMLYSGSWSAPDPWYKAHVRPFELIIKR